MSPIAKIILASRHPVILTLGFILTLPIQFLIGIKIAEWLT